NLIDRQHPHDLFMEMAVAWSHPIRGRGSVFAYAGWPGEPAVGPPVFMHRASGAEIPVAPIAHHWPDATHISFGTATAGLVRGRASVPSAGRLGATPSDRVATCLARPPLAPSRVLDSLMAEANVHAGARHTVFARAAHVDKDELFPLSDPLHDRVFPVGSLLA